MNVIILFYKYVLSVWAAFCFFIFNSYFRYGLISLVGWKITSQPLQGIHHGTKSARGQEQLGQLSDTWSDSWGDLVQSQELDFSNPCGSLTTQASLWFYTLIPWQYEACAFKVPLISVTISFTLTVMIRHSTSGTSSFFFFS